MPWPKDNNISLKILLNKCFPSKTPLFSLIAPILSLSQIFSPHSGGSDGKASAYNAGDLGSIPVLGRSPGEGNGNPLHYSCLENPMDREAW